MLNKTRNLVILATLSVVAHFAVSLIHGRAHESLAVGLSGWQNIYVMTVILAAPLIAMVLTWTRYARFGFVLLLISMAGSLIFGALYHYVIISPDHVSHLPPGDAQGAFRTTAMLLMLIELCGVIVGLLGSIKNRTIPAARQY